MFSITRMSCFIHKVVEEMKGVIIQVREAAEVALEMSEGPFPVEMKRDEHELSMLRVLPGPAMEMKQYLLGIGGCPFVLWIFVLSMVEEAEIMILKEAE